MSFSRKGKPRSAGSSDDDGEGWGAGLASIGSSGRLPEQEDAAYSHGFLNRECRREGDEGGEEDPMTRSE